MGKNNKARRAAKARARRRSSFGSPRSSWRPFDHADPLDPPFFSEPEMAAELLRMAAEGRRRGDHLEREALARLVRLDATVVHKAAERHLLDLVSLLWAHGWQPVELLRQGRRALPAGGARLVALAVAVDDAGRRASTIDQRWAAQVEGLDLPPADGRSGWVRRWLTGEGQGAPEGVSALVDVLVALTTLPPLEVLLPPPGSAAAGDRRSPVAGPASTAVSDPILEKVRALLAKAESTEFEAEATAFTAKAQELVARHAVDVAMLHASGGADRDSPVTVRLAVDEPYVGAKSLLLQVVAEAGRCRSVFHSQVALSSVVGFPTDVSAVEMLFTSLLVQAQSALSAAAAHAPPGTRTRSRSYRSAFLLAYAQRIGDRLAEINDAVLSGAQEERGSSVLPALRARSTAVDDAIDAQFGELRSSTVRGGYDAAGWAGGRAAADQARLAFADLPAGAG